MRTNIDIDDALIDDVRRLTGLATKKDIVDAALRYYVAALREDDFEPTSKLGDQMRAEQRQRDLLLSGEERVADALARGRAALEAAAAAAQVSVEEMRARQEAAQARSRRRGR